MLLLYSHLDKTDIGAITVAYHCTTVFCEILATIKS